MQTVSRDPAHIFIINFVIAILKARGEKINRYMDDNQTLCLED
jgi:hypothetical protein